MNEQYTISLELIDNLTKELAIVRGQVAGIVKDIENNTTIKTNVAEELLKSTDAFDKYEKELKESYAREATITDKASKSKIAKINAAHQDEYYANRKAMEAMLKSVKDNQEKELQIRQQYQNKFEELERQRQDKIMQAVAGKKVDASFKENKTSLLDLIGGKEMLAAGGIGAAIAGVTAIVDGIKQGMAAEMEFQRGLAEVTTLLGDAGKQFKEAFSSGLQSLAVESGQNTKTLTKGLYDLISSGVQASDSMNVLSVATKTAIATSSESSTVVDGLTSVINAYGESFNKSAEYMDIAFKVVQAGKIDMTQLSSVIGQVAPAANILGVNFKQTGAALAALTLNGVKANEAATALNGLFTQLSRSEVVNKFKEFGIEVLNAEGKIDNLQTVIEQFAAKKLTSTQIGQIITDESGKKAMSILQNMAQNGTQLKDVFNTVADSAGSIQGAYNIMSETSAFKAAQVQQQWEQVSRSIGSEFVGVGTSIKKVLLGIVDDFDTLEIKSAKAFAEGEQYNTQARNLEKVGAGYLEVVKNIEELKAKQTELTASGKDTSAVAEQLKQKYDELAKSTDNVKNLSPYLAEELKKVAENSDLAKGKIEEIVDVLDSLKDLKNKEGATSAVESLGFDYKKAMAMKNVVAEARKEYDEVKDGTDTAKKLEKYKLVNQAMQDEIIMMQKYQDSLKKVKTNFKNLGLKENEIIDLVSASLDKAYTGDKDIERLNDAYGNKLRFRKDTFKKEWQDLTKEIANSAGQEQLEADIRVKPNVKLTEEQKNELTLLVPNIIQNINSALTAGNTTKANVEVRELINIQNSDVSIGEEGKKVIASYYDAILASIDKNIKEGKPTEVDIAQFIDIASKDKNLDRKYKDKIDEYITSIKAKKEELEKEISTEPKANTEGNAGQIQRYNVVLKQLEELKASAKDAKKDLEEVTSLKSDEKMNSLEKMTGLIKAYKTNTVGTEGQLSASEKSDVEAQFVGESRKLSDTKQVNVDFLKLAEDTKISNAALLELINTQLRTAETNNIVDATLILLANKYGIGIPEALQKTIEIKIKEQEATIASLELQMKALDEAIKKYQEYKSTVKDSTVVDKDIKGKTDELNALQKDLDKRKADLNALKGATFTGENTTKEAERKAEEEKKKLDEQKKKEEQANKERVEAEKKVNEQLEKERQENKRREEEALKEKQRQQEKYAEYTQGVMKEILNKDLEGVDKELQAEREKYEQIIKSEKWSNEQKEGIRKAFLQKMLYLELKYLEDIDNRIQEMLTSASSDRTYDALDTVSGGSAKVQQEKELQEERKKYQDEASRIESRAKAKREAGDEVGANRILRRLEGLGTAYNAKKEAIMAKYSDDIMKEEEAFNVFVQDVERTVTDYASIAFGKSTKEYQEYLKEVEELTKENRKEIGKVFSGVLISPEFVKLIGGSENIFEQYRKKLQKDKEALNKELSSGKIDEGEYNSRKAKVDENERMLNIQIEAKNKMLDRLKELQTKAELGIITKDEVTEYITTYKNLVEKVQSIHFQKSREFTSKELDNLEVYYRTIAEAHYKAQGLTGNALADAVTNDVAKKLDKIVKDSVIDAETLLASRGKQILLPKTDELEKKTNEITGKLDVKLNVKNVEVSEDALSKAQEGIDKFFSKQGDGKVDLDGFGDIGILFNQASKKKELKVANINASLKAGGLTETEAQSMRVGANNEEIMTNVRGVIKAVNLAMQDLAINLKELADFKFTNIFDTMSKMTDIGANTLAPLFEKIFNIPGLTETIKEVGATLGIIGGAVGAVQGIISEIDSHNIKAKELEREYEQNRYREQLEMQKLLHEQINAILERRNNILEVADLIYGETYEGVKEKLTASIDALKEYTQALNVDGITKDVVNKFDTTKVNSFFEQIYLQYKDTKGKIKADGSLVGDILGTTGSDYANKSAEERKALFDETRRDLDALDGENERLRGVVTSTTALKSTFTGKLEADKIALEKYKGTFAGWWSGLWRTVREAGSYNQRNADGTLVTKNLQDDINAFNDTISRTNDQIEINKTKIADLKNTLSQLGDVNKLLIEMAEEEIGIIDENKMKGIYKDEEEYLYARSNIIESQIEFLKDAEVPAEMYASLVQDYLDVTNQAILADEKQLEIKYKLDKQDTNSKEYKKELLELAKQNLAELRNEYQISLENEDSVQVILDQKLKIADLEKEITGEMEEQGKLKDKELQRLWAERQALMRKKEINDADRKALADNKQAFIRKFKALGLTDEEIQVELRGLGLRQYDKGGYISSDQVAKLHAGEYVLNTKDMYNLGNLIGSTRDLVNFPNINTNRTSNGAVITNNIGTVQLPNVKNANDFVAELNSLKIIKDGFRRIGKDVFEF